MDQKVHIVPRSTTKVVFLKCSIFIRFTCNLTSCIFGYLIQPPIIFEVEFLLWILQVSCSARRRRRRLISLSVCLSLFVCRISQKVVDGFG